MGKQKAAEDEEDEDGLKQNRKLLSTTLADATTFRIATLSINTLSIIALNEIVDVTVSITTLSIGIKCLNAES